MTAHHCWCYTFVVVVSLCQQHSSCSHGQDAAGEGVRQQFIAEAMGPKKGILSRRLLQGTEPHRINELCCDDDTSVALVAAWQRVEMQVKAQLVGPDRGAAIIPVPQDKICEFLGFVEGRVQVPLPDAWLKCVSTLRFNMMGDTLLPVQLHLPQRESTDDISRIFTERHSRPTFFFDRSVDPPTIAVNGGDRFVGADGVIIVPNELKDEFKELRTKQLSGICSVDRGVVVVQNQDGPGGYAYCLSTRRPLAGEPRMHWKSRIDASWMSNSKGTTIWFTDLRVRGPKVYLFHCSDISFGIECLTLDSGKREFSFNSRTK